MIAGHRWERDSDWLGFRCVPLPIGGVESHQWCVGCNCFVKDSEIKASGFQPGEELGLDIVVCLTGHEPVEAGTLAELRLKRGQYNAC